MKGNSPDAGGWNVEWLNFKQLRDQGVSQPAQTGCGFISQITCWLVIKGSWCCSPSGV
jgi:hypothetical protein